MVMKSTLRGIKNVTHGYSDAAAKVRSATSNDSTPPSGLQMHEIATLSYNPVDLPDIIEQLEKRLNDKGKYWRHVYKSLCVLDYLLHSGAPPVAAYFRQNLYVIKTLNEFQHIDETGRDVGGDVRARAREVTRLLLDDRRLEEARRRRRRMRDRMQGRAVTNDSDDEEERPKRAVHKPKEKRSTAEERDMQRALELSAKAEEDRKRMLAEQAKEGVFDDQKNDLIDLTSAEDATQPLTLLQPQYTQMPTQYTSYSLQPQYTQAPFQPQYTQAPLQPQYTQMPAQITSYDPYAQQAQYDAMIQAEYARQQAEAQQQYALQMQRSMPSLQPQPTAHGSNNPFAQPSTPQPFSAPSPSLSYQYTASSTPALTHRPSTASSMASSLPPATPASVGRREDTALARLYAARTGGDGVDTFGNAGELRYGSRAYGQPKGQVTGAGMRAGSALS
ncbi:ENTH-domain-containing protein [Artomyces pyxidatus]|uniref:ENTH-domain-containing protein n=1 Tax=Artomyces pyxidatus TaxID=48021 RepID=A0ACB8TCJ5_9AGAM|nr:ENTH-domain-containing protein [Artomyces pyxidatus]